jgi:hypothetical protein
MPVASERPIDAPESSTAPATLSVATGGHELASTPPAGSPMRAPYGTHVLRNATPRIFYAYVTHTTHTILGPRALARRPKHAGTPSAHTRRARPGHASSSYNLCPSAP